VRLAIVLAVSIVLLDGTAFGQSTEPKAKFENRGRSRGRERVQPVFPNRDDA